VGGRRQTARATGIVATVAAILQPPRGPVAALEVLPAPQARHAAHWHPSRVRGWVRWAARSLRLPRRLTAWLDERMSPPAPAEGEERMCVVCMEEKPLAALVGLLPKRPAQGGAMCGHGLCRPCAEAWHAQCRATHVVPSCPICRRPFALLQALHPTPPDAPY
jgi:hypothetical protein